MFTSTILIATLATAPAQSADARVDRLKPELGRVARMEPAEQQAFLRRVEQRAGRAARLTMPPEEATRQQAATRAQLHQARITWQTLLDVMVETDRRERAAMEQLASRYQKALSEHVGNQSAEHARRQRAWNDVLAAWQNANEPFEQQDRLLDWLEAALVNITGGSSAMPERPVFDGRKAPTAAPRETVEPPGPRHAAEEPKPKPAQRPPQPPKPTAREIVEEIIDKPATQRPTEPPLPLPEPASDMSLSSRQATQFQSRRHDSNPVVLPTGPVGATNEAALRQQPTRANTPGVGIAGAAEPKPQITAAPTALPRYEAKLASPPSSAVQVRREIAAAKPAQTPAEREPQTTNQTAAHNTVEIRQDELAARISGYNLAIRALEIDLDEAGESTVARLEPLVERLSVLALRRHDLNLFREAVPESQRSSLAELASINSLISQLAARIFQVRGQTSGTLSKGTDQERQAELRRLEDLSRRLAALVEK